jgi:hypothetical protein
MHARRTRTWTLATILASTFSCASPGSGSAPAAGGSAAETFALLRSLEGEWIGRSTKGWEERKSFATIAGGSAVVETSLDAHPGEQMLTTFVLDEGRLLLTHYCIAGNQPRLVATAIEDDGRTVLFEFLDASNLTSRNVGHMDSCAMRFLDEDHFTTRWTWYQDGAAQWMEEIECERVRRVAAPASW